MIHTQYELLARAAPYKETCMSEASLLNVGEVILNFAICAVACSFYHGYTRSP